MGFVSDEKGQLRIGKGTSEADLYVAYGLAAPHEIREAQAVQQAEEESWRAGTMPAGQRPRTLGEILVLWGLSKEKKHHVDTLMKSWRDSD